MRSKLRGGKGRCRREGGGGSTWDCLCFPRARVLGAKKRGKWKGLEEKKQSGKRKTKEVKEQD